MLKKRNCKNCNKKISDKYEFCPYCGNPFNENSEDWGMLGKTDKMNQSDQFSNPFFGGGMLGKMLGRTMKMLEKEMQKEFNNQNSAPKTNFELIINGKRINPKNIKISQQPIQNQAIQEPKIIPKTNFSNKNLKKISTLPKEEPSTKIRRLANKVIYEISLPEVKSIDDISILRLENSIEIKALAKDKAYFKSIPINLPIMNYILSEGKLVLEFEIKNQ